MTESQWNIFTEFKESFKARCLEWQKFSDDLIPLQKKAAMADTPDYSFETPVVYNTALDELTKDSQIKLILIGDNPGKSEQLKANRKYLVGQAGKLADRFFKQNPEFQIDFRQNVIILNKTPVHSAKTKHLSKIAEDLSSKNSPAKNLILESQQWLAKETARLHKNLCSLAEQENSVLPQLWLVGYAELKKGGIFVPYKEILKQEYSESPFWNSVFVFQHFSMNRFTIDLKNFLQTERCDNQVQALAKLGTQHKNELF
ncbi:MAG: hypothetical protein ACI4LX_07595 [Treponema sp.]